jgi:regulatory protein
VPREIAPPTTLDRALRLLAVRARTEAELDRALERKGVPAEERQTALARLRELGYMDDAAVAEGRARSLIGRGASQRLAEKKLRSQGVQAVQARAAVAEAAEGQSERALVEQALARRLRGRPPKDEKERRRLFRALVQQGHRASLVSQALKLSEEVQEVLDDESVEDAE